MAKQDITITINLNEVEYDVKNTTYLIGRALSGAGSSAAQVSNVQVTDDAERINLVRRCVGEGVSRVKHLLSEWMLYGGVVADNALPNGGSVALTLSMPTNFALSAVDDLSASVQKYVTDYALGNWCSVMDKSRAADYYASASASLEVMRDASLRRKRPTRICRCGYGYGGGDYLWHDDRIWNDAALWTEQ